MQRIFILSLLLALLSPALAKGEDPFIIIATDLHYISPALTDRGGYFTRMIESADGKVTAYCDPLADAFLQEVIAARPQCLILSGDISFNGARKSHEDLAAKLENVVNAGIPVLVMPGNHDLNMRSAAAFKGEGYTLVPSVTADEFASIYHACGFDTAIARDLHSLSYIAEPIPGVRILMLDTNTPGAPCAVAAPTLLWLEEQLQKAQADQAKVISVTHQNLYAHSDLLSRGFVISNARELLALYNRYSVKVNLSGHMHLQHTKRSHSGILDIATSSLSVSPCQYGVITLGSAGAEYQTQSVNVSAWAEKNGKTDPNLLDFAAYADHFFKGRSREQIAASLSNHSPEDAAAMADFSIALNYAYFSGRLDAFKPDERIQALWAQENTSFWGLYVASMLRESGVNHTCLTFPY
ncbi:MAG: metallophosphoesterase [Clostridia bacterium]|nr:metallophosphoesterase [Clostridia bacterium]